MTQLPLTPAILADLQLVDQVVRDRLRSQQGVVPVLRPYSSNEQRLRAALTLLSAQLGNYRLEQVLHAASAVELIHAATSAHEELVDGATRRTNPAALRGSWNSGVPLMIGDYLFALSAGEMALSPDPRVIGYFAQAVMRICEGELTPVLQVAPFDTAREQYLAYIADTAGALFEASCKAGMATGEGTTQQIEALGRFGLELGCAFQMANDARRYNGDAGAREALQQGKLTLPIIYAAAADSTLVQHVDLANLSNERSTQLISTIRLAGVQPALQEANQLLERALFHLRPFAHNSAYHELTTLAQALVESQAVVVAQ